jgi:hypothetical protein
MDVDARKPKKGILASTFILLKFRSSKNVDVKTVQRPILRQHFCDPPAKNKIC